MAKFSLFKEEEEEEDDDDDVEADDYVHQVNPKRRRRSNLNPENPCCSSSTSSASTTHNHHHHHHNHDHHDEEETVKSCDEDNNNNSESNSTERTNNSSSGGPISVILSDPEVLDCSICFEPLTIPVFQCDNGHVACSTCYKSLGDICPSRCGKIGKKRCFAIEKVIESIKVKCRYSKNGCKETVSYSDKNAHEEKCSFVPCFCPFTNCLFRDSPQNLSQHMYRQHAGLVVSFCYNSPFLVFMGNNENLIVLREEKDGTLFILSHGNTVAIRCVTSNSSDDGFEYDIVLQKGCSSLNFQSSTHNIIGQLSVPPSVDYVTVPSYFHTGGCLKLEVCVWSKGGKARSSVKARR